MTTPSDHGTRPRRLARLRLAAMLLTLMIALATLVSLSASVRSPTRTLPMAMMPESLQVLESHRSHASQEAGEGNSSVESASKGGDDASRDRVALLVGTWNDDFYGRRQFTFAEDGTAVMTLELDSIGKMLYGPKLTFFIDWSLEGDVLTMRMTGGEPKETAETVSKLFGESSQQRILSLSETEMTLLSLDSQKKYVHRRENKVADKTSAADKASAEIPGDRVPQ